MLILLRQLLRRQSEEECNTLDAVGNIVLHKKLLCLNTFKYIDIVKYTSFY